MAVVSTAERAPVGSPDGSATTRSSTLGTLTPSPHPSREVQTPRHPMSSSMTTPTLRTNESIEPPTGLPGCSGRGWTTPSTSLRTSVSREIIISRTRVVGPSLSLFPLSHDPHGESVPVPESPVTTNDTSQFPNLRFTTPSFHPRRRVCKVRGRGSEGQRCE